MIFLFAFGLPVAAVVGAVLVRRVWPRRLTSAVLGAVLLLTALDLVAWTAIATDFRDADGFIDCWPSCTPLQDAVGGTIFWSPIVMTALVVVTAASFGLASVAASRETAKRRW